VEPDDKLVITATIPSGANSIEATSEYVDDPTQSIARNQKGQVLRVKMKITISFSSTTTNSIGFFKNVQISLTLPPNVQTEQTTFKFDTLSFGGRSSTPHVIQLYLYPTKQLLPIDSKITLSATYQQMKDESSQNNNSTTGGQLRTSSAEVMLPLAFFVSIVPMAGVKDAAEAKLNLVLNKAAPQVVSLFEEVVQSHQAMEICTNKK
jgi:hypothetical protein